MVDLDLWYIVDLTLELCYVMIKIHGRQLRCMILHLYPFLKVLPGKQDRLILTIILFWSIILATLYIVSRETVLC